MSQVPGGSNQKEPAEVESEAYRERNRVEQFFAKMKQFRRAATRYEKLKVTFGEFLNLRLRRHPATRNRQQGLASHFSNVMPP